MHPLKAYMSLHSDLNDSDWEKIQPHLTYRIFQENRIILKPGSICQNLYFLENGSIRFFTSEDGNDVTTHLLQPPFLFTSAHSFTEQVPSIEGIQAVDESYLWIISREDAYKLLQNPSWNNFISNL